MKKRLPILWSPTFWLVGVVGGLAWGFYSGRLIYTGRNVSLASYKAPTGAPVAEIHPEVLNLQASFAKVAEMVKPAVVSISTVHIEQVPEAPMFYFGDPFEQFFDDYFGGQAPAPQRRRRSAPPRTREFRQEGVGTGVIIDPEGLVLTNEHVVRGADEIKVLIYDTTGNKTDYVGKVIGKDARTDLAVVRIKGRSKFPFAKLGDSEKVRVGDWSIAIGSPFGLAQTVTVGVISAARQSLAIEDREYRNMIQTDAAINRGNSGGPLLNIYGEVIGINTAIYAPTGVFSGIGFAVPINQAKQILDDLVSKGRVVRGWLGVEMGREITPAMVKVFGLPNEQGAFVNNVLPNSPASKAGLVRGDVIRSFDGKPVESSDRLQALVAQTPPNRRVEVTIIRQRKTLTLSLTLGERPDSADSGEEDAPKPGSEKNKSSLEKTWEGARVAALTPELAEHFRQPSNAEGVAVVEVDQEGSAAAIGLMPGDVIRSINQTPTPNPEAFARTVKSVKLSEGIVLDVLRQGRPIYLSYTKP